MSKETESRKLMKHFKTCVWSGFFFIAFSAFAGVFFGLGSQILGTAFGICIVMFGILFANMAYHEAIR